jgi:membrane-bound lytic murein transglycosylase D
MGRRQERTYGATSLGWAVLCVGASALAAPAATSNTTPTATATPTSTPTSNTTSTATATPTSNTTSTSNTTPIPPPVPRSAAKAANAAVKKPAPKLALKSSSGIAVGRGAFRGSGVAPADPAARRQIAGGPTADDVAIGAETPELRALRDAERELFPPAMPPLGMPWPDQLPSPLTANPNVPRIHATGLPPTPPETAPPIAEGGKDLSWLAHLELPDLPVRWDARVVRYLEFYKSDPRGRQLFAYWLRRSGRFREAVRRAFRKKALPEDLSWIAMVESGYDASARSPAGAVGLWQFMPETGRLYGLSIDRWADQRLNVSAETDAAAEFMGDLYRRFGTWELAVASYNMGYAGMMSLVRRYNTNDYWALSRLEGSLPWETSLYVPKLIAIAIVGRNLETFGYADVSCEAPIDSEEIRVAPGMPLAAVAQAAGVPTKELEALNLELRAGRTPPAPADTPPGDIEGAYYPVKVPRGKGATALLGLARTHGGDAPLERYVVRFGETVDQIAATRHVTAARIAELNAVLPGEVIRGGTVLFLPKGPPAPAAPAHVSAEGGVVGANKAVVFVPPDLFVYPDRRRVFYRVVVGDTVKEIADAFHVTVDDLRRWNDIDPAGRLLEGMTLQVFVPTGADLSKVSVLAENDARVVPVGSSEFFDFWEGAKGKRRIVIQVRTGDTLETIGKRYAVSPATMERVNRRGRNETLKDGESVVVYLSPPPGSLAVASKGGATGASSPNENLERGARIEPVSNGPLPEAPYPDGLPPLPDP